jgi:hypothetical protein
MKTCIRSRACYIYPGSALSREPQTRKTGSGDRRKKPQDLMRAVLVAVSGLFRFFNLPDTHRIEADDVLLLFDHRSG